MSATKTASEDEPGEKWDRCIADTILKTGEFDFVHFDVPRDKLMQVNSI